MSTIRNEALTLNLLSFCPQDQRVPTRLRTFCLWNQCKRISSAVSPQRSAADSNARLQFTFSSISKAPEQLEVLNLSWCIVCLKEKHNKQDNWYRFSFSPKLESLFKFPVPHTSAMLIYCTATQNQTDTPSPQLTSGPETSGPMTWKSSLHLYTINQLVIAGLGSQEYGSMAHRVSHDGFYWVKRYFRTHVVQGSSFLGWHHLHNINDEDRSQVLLTQTKHILLFKFYFRDQVLMLWLYHLLLALQQQQ